MADLEEFRAWCERQDTAAVRAQAGIIGPERSLMDKERERIATALNLVGEFYERVI